MKVGKYPPSSFVEAELRRCGLEIKKTSSDILIPCPFHKDTHPSLGVSIGGETPTGIFHCFGCSITGTWNKLAKRLGLRLWNSNDEDSIFVVKSKKDISVELKQDNLKLSKWTDDYTWKKYSSSFLSEFGARLLYDKVYKTNYLYLPITYLNETYGYCKVRLKETDPGPKYWFNAKLNKVLYPIDYILANMPTDCIVLVEGMGDVFRLLQYGIPSLSLLGVSITNFMHDQLEMLAAKNIILCLDGDNPGKEAALGSSKNGNKRVGLASILEKQGYNVKMLFPPDDRDPDDMPVEYVHALGKLCESLGGPKYTKKRLYH